MLFLLFLQISHLSSSYKCFLHFEILHLTIFLFSWSVGNFQLQNQVKTNCISVLLLKIDKKDRVYHFYIQTMPHLPFEIHSHYSQSSNHLKVLSNSPNWSPMKGITTLHFSNRKHRRPFSCRSNQHTWQNNKKNRNVPANWKSAYLQLHQVDASSINTTSFYKRVIKK